MFPLFSPIGMPLELFSAKLRRAAASGDRRARLLLAASDAKGGPSVTMESFAAWRCPTCGSRAKRASGRNAIMVCQRGHTRSADGRFSLKAMLAKP